MSVLASSKQKLNLVIGNQSEYTISQSISSPPAELMVEETTTVLRTLHEGGANRIAFGAATEEEQSLSQRC